MPQNVFRRVHAKYNALAQTSSESTRKHTIFMEFFFPARAASVGRRRGKGQWRAKEQAAVRRGWYKDMERDRVFDRG